MDNRCLISSITALMARHKGVFVCVCFAPRTKNPCSGPDDEGTRISACFLSLWQKHRTRDSEGREHAGAVTPGSVFMSRHKLLKASDCKRCDECESAGWFGLNHTAGRRTRRFQDQTPTCIWHLVWPAALQNTIWTSQRNHLHLHGRSCCEPEILQSHRNKRYKRQRENNT